jgi:hypothetical protein
MHEGLLQSTSPLVKRTLQGRERQVVNYLISAIETRAPVDVYAQIRAGHFGSRFWYKVFFLTPHGIWRSDTGGEGIERPRVAWSVIRRQQLALVSLDALLHNWSTWVVWAIARPMGAHLVRVWERRQLLPLVGQAWTDSSQRRRAPWN